MADIISKEKRSENMSAIRSKDTKPEVYIRKLLFSNGYRYRKNSNLIIGHPDMYLAKYRTAVFVNGCFWHRHPNCVYAYTPKSKVEFWTQKFEANKKRDTVVQNNLRENKIKCLVIWECTAKKMKKDNDFEQQMMDHIRGFFVSDALFMEL